MPPIVLATHECLPPRDICCSRNSSTGPLPWVPRQISSAPDSCRISNIVAPLIDPTPSSVIFACDSLSTPPSSNSAPAPTPPPAKTDLSDGTPSTPQPSTPVILSRYLSESHADALPTAEVAQRVRTPPLPRRRSGEPLKSSLKLKGTPSRGSLTVFTDSVNSCSSKNTPATLAHMGVRFHSQLEHVKLFLAKQKPLAVSRDGYPTDTSGTDSDLPSYSYVNERTVRPLVMHRIDVPTTLPLADDTRDVAIESIDLVGTTIKGIVRVRNLAFEKWIAVRFTLDEWQTTSEVTARYKETVPDGIFDRFVFTIKLGDVLSRAEKTLYLAVRYSVSGGEIWDNNGGRNYQVRIVREKALEANKATVVESREDSSRANDIADLRRKLEQVVKLGSPSGTMVESCEDPSRANDIADLRRKLEQVVKLGSPSGTISGILARESRRRWESPSPTRSPSPRDASPNFKSEGFPAARYGIPTASRTSRRPVAVRQTRSHARTNTFPCARPTSMPWSHSQSLRALCGSQSPSPPDTDEIPLSSPDRDPDGGRDLDDGNVKVPTLRRRRSSDFGARNHARGGTIDLSDAPGVKRTAPTSPFE